MDPITITMIVLSAANAAYGLFHQNKANQQAKQEGQLLIEQQQAQNEADFINGDAEFIRLQAQTRNQLSAELAALKEQQQQARQLAQSSLLAAVIILIVLACYQALKKRPRTSIN